MSNQKAFVIYVGASICMLLLSGSLNIALSQEGFKGAGPATVYKRPVKKTSHSGGAPSVSKTFGRSVELNNKGNELYDQGKYDEAVSAYKQAISLKPNYAEAYLNLGDAYSALDRNEEAITAYKQALRFKPNDEDAYLGLGDAYQALGRKAEADEAYSHAFKNFSAGEGRKFGGGLLNGNAISMPKPEYPPIARAAHASGTVSVQVIIDETGQVIRARAVAGHPLLQEAAVRAASQARFIPTRLSGQPVKVSGIITYNFVLQ